MPEGGELTFSTVNILFDKQGSEAGFSIKPGRYIEIDIEDTGVGMSSEVKSRAFEPFFTTKGLGKGTGLGLSVVYNTIKDNQGFIDIYSEVEKGTVMKVYLPVPKDLVVSEVKSVEQLIQGSGRVLVIDDESIVRIIAGEMLQEIGYEVAFASDGRKTF